MTAPTPVRWGILATGGIASKFVEDLPLAPGAVAAAVASRTMESAQAFATKYGIPRAYGSWAELAADPDIDIVYVATPHSHHYQAAGQMLAAGVPVLCEKAFTLTASQAEELVAVARRDRLFLMEAMWMRTNPAIRRAVELVAGGAIGEVVGVRADIALPSRFPPEHRLRNPSLGGGALLDLGVYPVNLAHLFLGPLRVECAQATLFPEGVDETTVVLLRNEPGAHALLACSIGSDMSITATIAGTTGRIEIPRRFYRPGGFTLIRGDGPPERIDAPVTGNGLHYEAIEAMDCLRAGRLESDLMPLRATLEVMGTLDEIRAQIGVEY